MYFLSSGVKGLKVKGGRNHTHLDYTQETSHNYLYPLFPPPPPTSPPYTKVWKCLVESQARTHLQGFCEHTPGLLQSGPTGESVVSFSTSLLPATPPWRPMLVIGPLAFPGDSSVQIPTKAPGLWALSWPAVRFAGSRDEPKHSSGPTLK